MLVCNEYTTQNFISFFWGFQGKIYSSPVYTEHGNWIQCKWIHFFSIE